MYMVYIYIYTHVYEHVFMCLRMYISCIYIEISHTLCIHMYVEYNIYAYGKRQKVSDRS